EEIEFLGRLDNQVKIRGFRVELEEIEAALLREESVGRAIVIAREDRPGERRLVGYIEAAAGHSVNTDWLRQQLKKSLPDYMALAAIVVLERLPLNVNGKVDRNALPEPEFTPKAWRAPRTPQEEILCSLFAELLGMAHVGLDDNFFELGAHSLLVTRLISRIRAKLGVEITIRSVFESPTVDSLAGRLSEATTARPAVRPMPRPPHIPLSMAHQPAC